MHIYDKKLTPKYAYYGMLRMREYSGFDCRESSADTQFVQKRFTSTADSACYIQLNLNGTYEDHTGISVSRGTYRYDGRAEFMLVPTVGSYCRLVVREDGSADRVESAGAVIHLSGGGNLH